MGLDRFVYWKKDGPRPTKNEIKKVLQDYLTDAYEGKITFAGGRFFVRLKGTASFPLRRIDPDSVMAKGLKELFKEQPERWFEVYIDDKYVDVITRMADEYTNVVAEGFAKLIARWWQGRLAK